MLKLSGLSTGMDAECASVQMSLWINLTMTHQISLLFWLRHL